MTLRRSTKLWVFVCLVIGLPFGAFYLWQQYDNYYAALPYYGPDAVDAHHVTDDFVLINQLGQKAGSANAQGKVAVVNFFFTSCPTICPAMNRQMQRVQEMYINDPDVLLMSLTVDPKRDTPARLKAYADTFSAKHDQWLFLTGDKKEIYRLARKSYFLTASDGDGGDLDFIHSENLVLVDREGHIRGYYDGTKPEVVDQLIRDITKLKSTKS